MWIKAGITIIFGGLVAACNTSSPAFNGVPAQTVQVGPSVFDVRRIGSKVELLRINAEYAPTFASIVPRASQAVVMATGCIPRPQSWTGEQTLMQVEIDCPEN